MFDVTLEFVVLLVVVGLVVAISGSPRVREVLLTIFGVLGFGLMVLALIAYMIFSRRQLGTEIARVEVPTGHSVEIQLDGLESLPFGKNSKAKASAAKTIVAKKPAVSSDSTEIEELPRRPAEPIHIDDQTRAEIEQQWREGQVARSHFAIPARGPPHS